MRTIEQVYKGRNSTNDLRLKAGGVAVDLSGVTKMELVGTGWAIASDEFPGVFDWSVGGGVVTLTLGAVENIPVGKRDAELIVYAPDNPLGIHWGMVTFNVQ